MPLYVPSTSIRELPVDPTEPNEGEVWILKTSTGGEPVGLLLALTKAVNSYQFSEYNSDGQIVRTDLT